jgi:hypothetical protein
MSLVGLILVRISGILDLLEFWLECDSTEIFSLFSPLEGDAKEIS